MEKVALKFIKLCLRKVSENKSESIKICYIYIRLNVKIHSLVTNTVYANKYTWLLHIIRIKGSTKCFFVCLVHIGFRFVDVLSQIHKLQHPDIWLWIWN